jgi:hypothetical protein
MSSLLPAQASQVALAQLAPVQLALVLLVLLSLLSLLSLLAHLMPQSNADSAPVCSMDWTDPVRSPGTSHYLARVTHITGKQTADFVKFCVR